jgi:hypothetical protein
VYGLQANTFKSAESLFLARELRESVQGEKTGTLEDKDELWDCLVSIFWR